MLTGLTDEQVNERIEQGKVNADENPNTRTYKQIVRENTLTFFNFLNLVLLVLVLLVGSYKNAFFVCIIIINTLIGIAQEIKAKKLVEKLTLLSQPKAKVERDGKEVSIPIAEVSEADILILESGTTSLQIVACLMMENEELRRQMKEAKNGTSWLDPLLAQAVQKRDVEVSDSDHFVAMTTLEYTEDNQEPVVLLARVVPA